jgi:hypothetical protein
VLITSAEKFMFERVWEKIITKVNSLVRSEALDARAAVLARIVEALLDVFGAVLALEAGRARALEFVVQRHRASAAVLAW